MEGITAVTLIMLANEMRQHATKDRQGKKDNIFYLVRQTKKKLKIQARRKRWER